MSLIIKLKVRTVVKDKDGLLDPTPRGACVNIAHRNDCTSPFLQLPGEIRNRIYTFVLSCFVYYNVTISGRVRVENTIRSLPLLYVCRRIYSEARLLPFTNHDILYTDLTPPQAGWSFRIIDDTNMPWFQYSQDDIFVNELSDLLPVQQEALTVLQISWLVNTEGAKSKEQLSAKPGLKRIVVYPMYDGPRWKVNMLYHVANFWPTEIPKIADQIREIVGNDVEIFFPKWRFYKHSAGK